MLNQLLTTKTSQTIPLLTNDKEHSYLIREGELIPIDNYSKNPHYVLFDGSDCKKGDILFHTHYGNDTAIFSDQDIQTSIELNIPILLYHTDFRQWDYYDPTFPHPYPLRIKNYEKITLQDYIRLKYSRLRCNCYTLAKNVAKKFFNIEYPQINFHSHNAIRVFLDPHKHGFVQRNDTTIKRGDIVLLYISKEIPFHVAVAVKEEPLLYLHILGDEHRSEFVGHESIKNNIVSVWTLP